MAINKIFFAIMLSLVYILITEQVSQADLHYCVPVKKIDWHPYREIVDGKELAYLVFLKSYISTDNNELGLISKYEFSPDGKTFTANVDTQLLWPDGDKVTTQELLDGIVKAFPFRTIGKKIKINTSEVLNPSTIQINFTSDIQNVTGVVREALSTNSRHNRFWPSKLSKRTGLPMVLSRVKTDDSGNFIFKGHKIQFEDASKCKNPEMTVFLEIITENVKNYTFNKSPTPSAIMLQLNTKSLKLDERKYVATKLRSAFSKAPDYLSVEPVKSFYQPGEPGFNPDISWDQISSEKLKPLKRVINIGYEQPIYKNILENYIELKNEIELIALPTSKQLDAQIYASGIQGGRYVIFQDILKWPHVNEMMLGAVNSLTGLKEIAKLSATTIPPNNEILANFEKTTLTEFSLIPLARRFPVAYTAKNLPITLSFTNKGELTFTEK